MEYLGHLKLRFANLNDLPNIHELLKSSWLALAKYTSKSVENTLVGLAELTINEELVLEKFHLLYNNDKKFRHLWVAEDKDNNVVGCIGCKLIGVDEVELIRLVVQQGHRGSGIGSALVQHLFSFCRENGFLRIQLQCFNPDSIKFYVKKCGFMIVSTHPLETYATRNHRLVKILGEKVVRSVCIVGGTHGNERIGVVLTDQWNNEDHSSVIKRTTFSSQAIMGNPAAVVVNRRYVDLDLNRQFSRAALDMQSATTSTSTDSGTTNSMDSSPEPYERQRARDLNEALGPKGGIFGECRSDFVIDLHSTTSTMGVTALVSAADADPLALALAHHLKQGLFPQLRIICMPGVDKGEAFSMESIAPSGITFEVGPLSHGTLDSLLLETTRSLVLHSLDFLEERNLKLLGRQNASLRRIRGRDITAPLPNGPALPHIEVFEFAATVDYPRKNSTPTTIGGSSSVAPTGASGSAESGTGTGSGFTGGPKSLQPLAAIIHPALAGRDWRPIAEGDPAFVTIDGSMTTIPFSLPPGLPLTSHSSLESIFLDEPSPSSSPESFFPAFIGEAAYYEKGTAFVLLREKLRTVY